MPVALGLRPEVVWGSWLLSVETVCGWTVLGSPKLLLIGNDTLNCIFNCNCVCGGGMLMSTGPSEAGRQHWVP